MKSLRYFLLLIIGLFSSLAHAEVYFFEIGVIDSISSRSITINDSDYHVSPTVKVIESNGMQRMFLSLNVGDEIEARIILGKKKALIDTIEIISKK